MNRLGRWARGLKGFSEPPFWAADRLSNRLFGSSPLADREQIENNFAGYVQQAYKTDGIVFAAIQARQFLLSQARYQWVEYTDGQPSPLFDSPELRLIDRPWQNGTTAELVSRMEVVSSLAGNYYGTTADDQGRLGKAAVGPGRRIVHMNPEWTEIIIDSKTADPWSLDARIVAFRYTPRGVNGVRDDAVVLLPEEVAHYSPIPDPIARFRGMSWLTPILTEIESDKAATLHKARFFSNGAHPSVMVSLKDVNDAEFDDFVEKFNASHRGADKAYSTLFLMGGADVNVVGKDLKELDFKATQGASETRIAAASGVHPVILGISEGLQGSSLNAGNFNAARRLTADKTLHSLWRMLAASLENLVPKPKGKPDAVLWPDLRQVPFTREDAKDTAAIAFTEAQTIRQLLDAGYKPDSARDAVMARDWSLLAHSGLHSVQLLPPGVAGGTPADGADEEETEA